MADIDINQLLNGLNSSIEIGLGNYSFGGGSRAFNVIVQDNELKESLRKAGEELARNNLQLRKTHEELEKNNKLTEEEIKQRSEKIALEKKAIEQQEINLGLIKKAVDIVSSIAGFATERAKIENEIYKTLNDTGFQLKEGTQQIGNYSTQLGLNVEAFTKFVGQNSAELNIVQNQFGDAINAVSLNWTKIAKETGASNEEQRKALSTYMKLVTTTGQIGQETQQSFQDNASAFIGNIKTLSKSLGVNTETILRNIESNEKQWQWQALLANEKTRDTALGLQARGASLDQIIYTTTGHMSEQMAKELINPLKNHIVQGDREAFTQGRLRTAEDFNARSEELRNDTTAKALYEQNYQSHQDTNNTMLGARNQDMNTILGYGATAEYQKAISMGNTPQSDEEKSFFASQSEKEIASATRENSYFKMVQIGMDELSEINKYSASMDRKVAKIYDVISKLPGRQETLGFLGKVGAFWDNGGKQVAGGLVRGAELTLSLRRNHLLAQIAGNTSETSMVKWAGNLLKGKLGTAGKYAMKGTQVAMSAYSGYKAYDSFSNGEYLDGTKNTLKAGLWATSPKLGIAGEIADIVGTKLGEGIAYIANGFSDGSMSKEEKEKLHQNALKGREILAQQQAQMDYNTPQTSNLKENKPTPPTDNLQNQKPQKVEIVNPTVANNSLVDNSNLSIDELSNVNGKLSQLVDLFTDVKTNIGQLASKMPLNNYG